MSFTIGRTYTLVAGRDYTGQNNVPTKIKATVTSGTATMITDSLAVARISAIVSAGSTAGIKGGAFPNFTLVSSATGTTVVAGTASTITGEYEFQVFDANVPTSDDSPVLGIHVLGSSAALSFNTFNGQTLTLPSGALVAGGIYDYSIGTVIGVTGSIIGVAPVSKPFII